MRNLAIIVVVLFAASYYANIPSATTCHMLPSILQNGKITDTNAVINDLYYRQNCANNSLAPINNPIFTGTTTMAQATITGNVRFMSPNAAVAAPAVINGTKWEPACTGVAAHDDPIVTDAFTWASSNNAVAIFSPGTCVFTTPVAVDTGGGQNQWGVMGQNTQLQYQGTSSTANLITIGGALASTNLYFAGFGITSATKMSAGCGFLLADTTHTVLRDVQTNSTNLYNGACLRGIGGDIWDGIFAAAQNDAVEVTGNGNPFQSDLWLENGVISVSSVGVHQGGGFGGLYLQNLDMIANATGVLYDTALTGTANQQLFLFPSTQVDSSTGDGIVINQMATSNGGEVLMEGWVASSGLDGVHVKNCKSCTVLVNGRALLDNAENGIEFDDASATQYMVDGLIAGNSTAGSQYYGLNCSSAMSVYVNTTIAGNAGARNIGPNCMPTYP
jgi:hypothetical protein